MSIGMRLKEWRINNHLKTTDIKEKTGLSTGGFSDYENDRKLIGSKTLITLSQYYDIDIQYILTGVRTGERNLTPEEQQLLEAYRLAAPGMQEAARKVLDMEPIPGKSLDCKIGEKAI